MKSVSHPDTDKATSDIHGKLRKVIVGIAQRCKNPNTVSFKDYGGRGIGISDEWYDTEKKRIKSKNFIAWAVRNGYKDGLVIDRIDTNGNYTPENCRWITIKANNRNKRNNKLITYNGETHCMSEWAERIGVKPYILKNRFREGWSIKDALTRPVELKDTEITYNGETKRIGEWSLITGLSYNLICNRIQDGWSPERTLTTPAGKGNTHFVEYKGKKVSLKEIAREYQIRYVTFCRHIREGYSIEESIKMGLKVA